MECKECVEQVEKRRKENVISVSVFLITYVVFLGGLLILNYL